MARDLTALDVIIIGASIRNGKHNPAVLDFIQAHRELLESRPSGFFSVNLVARKPAKNTPETNPYVRAFIAKSPWKPRLVACSAAISTTGVTAHGSQHHPVHHVDDEGPDRPDRVDYTDWSEVRRFAAASPHWLRACRLITPVGT